MIHSGVSGVRYAKVERAVGGASRVGCMPLLDGSGNHANARLPILTYKFGVFAFDYF